DRGRRARGLGANTELPAARGVYTQDSSEARRLLFSQSPGMHLRRISISAAVAIALALAPGLAARQLSVWTIDPGHSAAQFTVRHMVVANVKGEFEGPTGTVIFDPKDLTSMRVDAMINAKSINTRNPDRDKDLKSDLFFDVAKYPRITFKSTKVEAAGEG